MGKKENEKNVYPETIYIHPWLGYDLGENTTDVSGISYLATTTVLVGGAYESSDGKYIRADHVPQWQPFPTDKDGFGLYDEVFAMKDSIIMYSDGTIFEPYEYDDELAGDIERTPSRYMWM